MNLDSFRLWKVKPLQDFLRQRGIKTSGSKDELVALVYACHVLDIRPTPTEEENKKTLAKEYGNLLLIDGTRLPDPFTELKTGWEDEESARKKWPPTMYADMVEFMHECRVSEQKRTSLLSDYKTGKGFSYFESNFLQQVFYHPITDASDHCFLTAKVTPSQNVSHVPHNAWVLIHKDSGKICSAFCTCKAGMFSQCNHVAAILFKVDWAWTVSEKSVTSVACQWNIPGGGRIQPRKICDMTIYKPQKEKSGEGRNINSASKRLFTPNRSRSDTPFSLDEWAGMLYDEKNDSVAFRYAYPHTEPVYVPEADLNVGTENEVETSAFIPRPLLDVAKEFGCAEDFLRHIESFPGDLKALEEVTRDQTSSTWAEQRRGRIGASIAHMCKTKMTTIKEKGDAGIKLDTVIGSVLGTGEDISSLPAVKYGREKEAAARRAYVRDHQKMHKHGAEVSLSGLVVSETCAFLSASPDGVVSCECGRGLVEIKCPFSGKGKAPGKHLSFLHEGEGGRLQLKRSHSYFTQCQQQLGVTGRDYCDFYVYCGPGLSFTERIFPDKDFMSSSLQLLQQFYRHYVAPALMSLAAADSEPAQQHPAQQHPVASSATSESDLTITVTAPPSASSEHSQVLLTVTVPTNAQNTPSKKQPAKGPPVPAPSQRATRRRKKKENTQPCVYSCGSCLKRCLEAEEISTPEEESVGCDGCGVWYHTRCVHFQDGCGSEKWYCPSCKCL